MERNDDDEQRRKKLEKGVYRADLFSDLLYIESVLRIFYEKKKKFSRNIFTREHTWINYTVFTEALKKVFAQQFLHPLHRHVLFFFWHL